MGLIALDMQSDGRMGNYYTVAHCEAKGYSVITTT